MTGTQMALDLAAAIAPALFFAIGLVGAWNLWKRLSQ